MGTAMVHSVFNIKHASVVPIVQGEHNQRMPPLMRGTNIIDPTCSKRKIINGARELITCIGSQLVVRKTARLPGKYRSGSLLI